MPGDLTASDSQLKKAINSKETMVKKLILTPMRKCQKTFQQYRKIAFSISKLIKL
jgi:hypothetical protein